MKKYITIGELASMFDISTSQIRFYEKKKILQPYTKDENGYRLYDYKQLDLLESILLFREIDIPISEIKNIVDNYDIDDYIELLECAYDRLEKQILEIQKKKKDVQRKINQVKKYMDLNDSINIVKIDKLELRVISNHDVDKLSLKDLYDKFTTYGFKFLSTYADIYTVIDNSDKLAICIEYKKGNKKLKEAEEKIIPAGEYYIKSFYIENYENIGKKVEEMSDYLRENNCKIKGSAIIKEESYSYSMNKIGSYISVMIMKGDN